MLNPIRTTDSAKNGSVVLMGLLLPQGYFDLVFAFCGNVTVTQLIVIIHERSVFTLYVHVPTVFLF